MANGNDPRLRQDNYDRKDRENSNAGMIAGVIIVLIGLAGIYLYYNQVVPPQATPVNQTTTVQTTNPNQPTNVNRATTANRPTTVTQPSATTAPNTTTTNPNPT